MKAIHREGISHVQQTNFITYYSTIQPGISIYALRYCLKIWGDYMQTEWMISGIAYVFPPK